VGAGTALSFNGSHYDSVGYSSSLDISTALTLEAWINPSVASDNGIIEKTFLGQVNKQYLLFIENGVGEFRLRNSVGLVTIWTDDFIPVNTWTHIAATWDGDTVKMFINGVQQTHTATVAPPLNSGGGQTLIGLLGGGAYPFTGIIDEVRVWSVARTQQQIRENMHLRLNGNETGLQGYWRFDEGTGSTTHDATSNGNDGTLIGFDTTTCWVASTAALGVGTSYSEMAFQSGYSTFGGMLALRDSCDTFDNPVDITVTRIMNPPNVSAVGSSTMLADRYWIVDVFGTPGTYGVDLGFTVPSSFTNDGAGDKTLYSLYKRGSNDDGAWSLDVAGADTVQDTSAYFKCRPSLGQFMLGTNEALPIQLASLTATTTANGVKLEWTTVSETNNYGFYVERRPQSTTTFATVSDLIPGVGTSLQVHQYEWTDMNVGPTTYVYRLKQMDLTGHVAYSNEITVASVLSVNGEAAPKVFQLVQNYPNPFNPTTEIKFSVEKQEHATVKVYSMLGQEVAQLFDGIAEPGHYYKFNFDGSRFGSGMYFYRIITDSHSAVRKMLMLK
jgi:hypothetical protein